MRLNLDSITLFLLGVLFMMICNIVYNEFPDVSGFFFCFLNVVWVGFAVVVKKRH